MAVQPGKYTKASHPTMAQYNRVIAGERPKSPSLHPKNIEKIAAVRRRKGSLTKHRERAHMDYVEDLERERAAQDILVAELRKTIDDTNAMMRMLIRQHEIQGTPPVLAIDPPPLDDVDMLASDEEFEEVRSSRKNKPSRLLAAAAAVVPPAPRQEAETRQVTSAASSLAAAATSNRFSSLSRAASESSGESAVSRAEEEEIEFTEDDMSVDLSVDETADRVEKLSLKKSKPGAQEDGTGRKK